MKSIKRLGALLLTALLTISTINTPVFAAEAVPAQETASSNSAQQQVVYDYEFEITPDMVGEDGSVIIPLSAGSVDQTFTMTTTHTGSTRTYYGNYLAYGATLSGAPGNILALQFYHSSGTKIDEKQYWCNGVYQHGYIPITSGNSYYIKYVLAYGTPTPITVHMTLMGVNR